MPPKARAAKPGSAKSRGTATPRAAAGTGKVWVQFGRGYKLLVNSDVGCAQLMQHLATHCRAGVVKHAKASRSEFVASISELQWKEKELEAAAAAAPPVPAVAEDEEVEDAEDAGDDLVAQLEKNRDLQLRIQGQMRALDEGVGMFDCIKSGADVALCTDEGAVVLAGAPDNRLVRANVHLQPNVVYTLGRRLAGEAGRCQLLVFAVPAVTAPMSLLHPTPPGGDGAHRRTQSHNPAELSDAAALAKMGGPPPDVGKPPKHHRRTRTHF